MNKTNKKPELRIHFLRRPSFPTVTNVYAHSRIFLDMDNKKRIQVCVCSKHLLHTRPRNVSIQVQSVRYQTPPGLNPRL